MGQQQGAEEMSASLCTLSCSSQVDYGQRFSSSEAITVILNSCQEGVRTSLCPGGVGAQGPGEAVLGQAECPGHDTRSPPVLGSSGPPEPSMGRSQVAPTLPPCFRNLRRGSP